MPTTKLITYATLTLSGKRVHIGFVDDATEPRIFLIPNQEEPVFLTINEANMLIAVLNQTKDCVIEEFC